MTRLPKRSGCRSGAAVTSVLAALGILAIASVVLFGLASTVFWLAATWFIVGILWFACHRFAPSSSAVAFFVAVVSAETVLVVRMTTSDLREFLVSDSAHYDLVAREIAEHVPLGAQLNPFHFQYVHDVGNSLGGAIAHPGFYKLLGVLYTLAAAFAIDPIALIVLGLNVLAFAAVGYLVWRSLSRIRFSDSRANFLLWVAFMANPYLLDQLVLIRKDLVILALFAAGIDSLLVAKRWHAFALAALLVPFRVWQGSLLLSGIFVHWITKSRGLAKVFRRRSIIVVAASLAMVALAVLPLWEVEVAPEVAEAYARDLREATFGLSSWFQHPVWGPLIYAWAYPFPSIRAADEVDAAVRSIFAMIWITLTGSLFLTTLTRKEWRTSYLKSSAGAALLWMFWGAFVGLYAVAAVSIRRLGFIVMEPRYKLQWYLLATVLVAMRLSEHRLVRNFSNKKNVVAAPTRQRVGVPCNLKFQIPIRSYNAARATKNVDADTNSRHLYVAPQA